MADTVEAMETMVALDMARSEERHEEKLNLLNEKCENGSVLSYLCQIKKMTNQINYVGLCNHVVVLSLENSPSEGREYTC